ncbi:MAG: MFS family permease [Gammaproteobacteria bacterium]
MQFFVNGAVLASFVPRLPEIRQLLGLSLDQLGVMLTIGAMIGLVASVASPAIIDRFGTRRALIALVILMPVGLVIIGLASTPVVFLIGFSAILMADGVVDVAMNLQGSWLSARRHTPVMNRLHGLWSLGTVAGGLVAAQAAASGVSLRTQLIVVAAALAAGLVFVGRGLLQVDEGGGELETVDGGVPKRTRARWIMLIVLAVSGGFALTVELVSSDWAAFRLSEDFDTSLGFAGLGFVTFTVGMTVGRLFGDAMLVRHGDALLFRGATVVSGIGLAVAAFAPHELLVLLGYAIAGVGISVFFPKLYDDAAKFPGRRGVALTWLRSGSSLMSLVIPTAVGVLAASRLSVGGATAIVTLPCIAGFFLLTFRRPAT